MNDFIILIALSILCLVLIVFILIRQSKGKLSELELQNFKKELIQEMQRNFQVESRENRIELTGQLTNFQQIVNGQLTSQDMAIKNFEETYSLKTDQLRETLSGAVTLSRQEQQTTLSQMNLAINDKLESMRKSLTDTSTQARKEQTETLGQMSKKIHESLHFMSETNDKKMAEMRNTLENKISQLQKQNEEKLEEMRKTVDEKLHDTLEQRLGESFRLVSERLENVHKSLGEMNQLAQGVGDLKRVLTNVKTRGTWGEVQLGMILEQMMTSSQYESNVETVPGSGAFVEYAIKLPGKGNDDTPIWLPIDAKFPKEQYERLILASEAGDVPGVATAGKEFEIALDNYARTISDKYLSAPYTTDFGLMFLPTEGLYAEAMKRPGLADAIQRKYRINIAGPSTLTALLNSLQMGFKTLAIEKSSSEVWQILGAVKTEFNKFGNILASTKKALEKVTKNIEKAEIRTRAMDRQLRSVEELPLNQSLKLLGLEDVDSNIENSEENEND